MELTSLALLCFFAFAISTVITKFAVDAYSPLAVRMGLVDYPDTRRRLQKHPIPVGGGVVLFLTTLLTLVGISVFADESVGIAALVSSRILIPLLAASAILVGVGLADDKWELSGWIKLSAQIVVATIVIAFAREFSTITFFGMNMDLGHMFYPLGILWLVGIINAVNFLDGADGVASMAGLFMSLTTGVFAMITGQTTILIISVVFSGALLGFLLCNFPPARVYLGDTGSMLIGLVTGVLLLRSCTVEKHVISIAPPLAVATIPIFDVILSFFRRMSSRRGLFAPDRGHIHHRFLVKFQCGRKILLWLGMFFLASCVAACFGMYSRNDWFPFVAVVVVPGVLILTGLFGKEETKILVDRFFYQWKKRWFRKKYDEKVGAVFRYQGHGPWDALWQDLASSLRTAHCLNAYLDINIPFLHESYISRWESPIVFRHNKISISCTIPLLYDRQKVGTLEVSFDVNYSTNVETLCFANEMGELCIKHIADYIQLQSGNIVTVIIQAQPLHKDKMIVDANPGLFETKKNGKICDLKSKILSDQ